MFCSEPLIEKITAREILDSRGNPTVEACVVLDDGSAGIASVPSGASTGIYEAHEKRDGNPHGGRPRYGGRGVLDACESVRGEIAAALRGMPAVRQAHVDRVMRELDGTPEKKRLGANAILAVSLANARACAASYGLPLWRWLGGIRASALPVPMFNVLNGGAHAANNVEIQEFMVVPLGAPSFAEALRRGAEIRHALGALLKERGLSCGVGDEGGFAPDLTSDEEALDLLVSAIDRAGYADSAKIALDAAASEWFDEASGVYLPPKRGGRCTAAELCARWESLAQNYPICSLEDGLDQRDFDGWAAMTARLGGRMMLVGDDLFVTNPERVRRGIAAGAANCVLVKPNQIGTLTETAEVTALAAGAGWGTVMSHRSGETEDSTLADLAVALGTPYIKAGAPCRSERLAKYNRLSAIEEEMKA